MGMQVLTIVLTSVLTSLLTLAGAWFALDRYLKVSFWPEFDLKADEAAAHFKEQVSEGVSEGITNGLTGLPTKATETATRTGLDMLEESLGMWFKPRKPKE